MPQIRFATQSYQSPSLPVSAQRMINFYAEKEPPDAKTQVAVFGVPGLVAGAKAGAGPIRGANVMNNVLYVVSAGSLYSVTLDAQPAVLLGSGIGGSGIVSMANNGQQVAIVNGVGGWIYTPPGGTGVAGFQQITDPNFVPSNSIIFFDGYFLASKINSTEVIFSSLYQGLTWPALQFFNTSVSSAYVTGLVNQQENLLIFTLKTIETWYDTGNNNLPFQRYDGATVERGCISGATLVKENNFVYFLGDDLIFYSLQGILPVRESTHAIEAAWQTYGTVTDAFAFAYTFNGHKFINLTFPSVPVTWVFDIASGLWHERVSYGASLQSLGRWRGNCATKLLGQTVIGDGFGNQIGFPSDTAYTEYGNQIVGETISPPQQANRKRMFNPLFELDIETGVGLPVGQGSNPQIMLDWSDDGGRTFNNLQLWQSMGREGAYLTRLRWKKLGQFRQRVYRVTCSDPVRRSIINAFADFSVGM
jgi:hypothetical protein